MAKKGTTVDKRVSVASSSSSGARAAGRDVYGRERALAREIRPIIEGGITGVDVLAVELLSPSRFCVFVDHPQGVDHALCSRVTHLLERWRSEFTIDVSSPGPNRPLRKPAHFAAAVGSVVSLRTDKEIHGQTRFRGELTATTAGGVTVTTSAESVEVPYEAIVRANVIDETT